MAEISDSCYDMVNDVECHYDHGCTWELKGEDETYVIWIRKCKCKRRCFWLFNEQTHIKDCDFQRSERWGNGEKWYEWKRNCVCRQ